MTIFEMVLTTVGTFISGGLAKSLLDRQSMTKNEQYQALLMLVDKLQKDVENNDKRIIHLEEECRSWRDKYYQELEEKLKLASENTQLLLRLRSFESTPTI